MLLRVVNLYCSLLDAFEFFHNYKAGLRFLIYANFANVCRGSRAVVIILLDFNRVVGRLVATLAGEAFSEGAAASLARC